MDTLIIEFVFRNYGSEEDLKAEELEHAFREVGSVIVSPQTPPRAGPLYELEIILRFVGKVLVTELVKAGGLKVYEKIRDGYNTLAGLPKLQDALFRPNLTAFYEDTSLVIGNLSRSDFDALPAMMATAAEHLGSPPLMAWKVQAVFFNIEQDVTASWTYQDHPWPPRENERLGRYWAVAASLSATIPAKRYTHVYDSLERTLVTLHEESQRFGSLPVRRDG